MDDQTRMTKAQALHSEGRSAEAAQLMAPLETRYAGNLQLQMGIAMIARAASDFDLALRCLSRSRKLAPQDIQIANIEANTLGDAGEIDASLSAFDRLLETQPDFIDGHINRALTAQSTDQAKALNLVNTSLQSHPEVARLWSIKGTALKNLGRSEEAIIAFRKAIELDPARALTWFQLGVTHRDLEQHIDAQSAYTKAEEFGASGPQFDSAKAAVALELGEIDEAESLYERAWAQGEAEAGRALARLRYEYRAAADAFAHYRTALATQQDNPALVASMLANMLDYRAYDELIEAGEQASRRFPHDREIAVYTAFGRAWGPDLTGGIAALEDLNHQRSDAVLQVGLAELHLLARQPEQAETFATAALASDPLDQGAWAFLATAWRLQDDPREFWLSDYENFVLVEGLSNDVLGLSPTEYAREIAAVLEPLHVTMKAPANQSLRGGTQTSGALFRRPNPQIKNMREAIIAKVRSAVGKLAQDSYHPFLGRKTDPSDFVGSWSVRLSGADEGHHASHFHGKGWISSAYYAKLPVVMKQGTDDPAGCIQFGAPPDHLGLDLPPRRTVRPEEGQLVLFPSYMWHGTIAFKGEDTRLTAAFDIASDIVPKMSIPTK